MVKIIKDVTKFKRLHDNGFLWSSEYKEEISKDDFNKRKEFLEKNIETLHIEIKKFDIEKLKEERVQKMELERIGIKEALTNYESYFEDKINEIKNNKQKHKEELQGIIANFDKAKEILLTQLEKNLKQRLTQLRNQLFTDNKQLEFFKNV